MNTETHSVGPWNLMTEDGDLYVDDHNEKPVAKICDMSHRSIHEDHANAILIAAAPELLAACEALEAFIASIAGDNNAGVLWKQLRAAIAKARGHDHAPQTNQSLPEPR